MYESLYGLNEDPFRMSLDARFSFHHRSYVEVKEYLEYGLSQGDGMLILLGEAGTGKSTVVNDLLGDHYSGIGAHPHCYCLHHPIGVPGDPCLSAPGYTAPLSS